MMNTIFSFILILGILIFIHEFGHFLFAKLLGIKVLKFSLGFGPTLAGHTYGETEYVISAFPLGGYVKMLGESPAEEVDTANDNRSFARRPVWQRFSVVAAGPTFNLLFSVFLFFMIYAVAGLPHPVDNTVVGNVTEESAAAAAGLKPGDVILSINGQPTVHWEEVSGLIADSGGKPVTLLIQRDDEQLELTGQPTIKETTNIFGEVIGERFLLGISRSDEMIYEQVSLIEALQAGISQTWAFIYLTIMGVVKIIQQVVPASELGGPILIAQLAGQQMEAGWINLLYFMGLISVNLGILNLMPIPILDGGHLFFFSMEAIMRKPLSMRTQEMLQQIGLIILASLMVFVFYNDLVRIFASS